MLKNRSKKFKIERKKHRKNKTGKPLAEITESEEEEIASSKDSESIAELEMDLEKDE